MKKVSNTLTLVTATASLLWVLDTQLAHGYGNAKFKTDHSSAVTWLYKGDRTELRAKLKSCCTKFVYCSESPFEHGAGRQVSIRGDIKDVSEAKHCIEG